jgi:hypothetical protein
MVNSIGAPESVLALQARTTALHVEDADDDGGDDENECGGVHDVLSLLFVCECA